MLLDNIASGRATKNHLLQMTRQGRIPHAVLFYGQDGGAQLPLSIAFSQYLFCPNRTAMDSCGQCPSCLKISKLSHPDLHIVFPVALSKDVRTSKDLIPEFREAFLTFPYLNLNDWFNTLEAENKQPVIPAEESNEIIQQLSYTSYEGGKKVMIIWMPEKMQGPAANKLLKILEEPPEDTFFFLVSSDAEHLLPTILSRTQLVQVNPPSEAEVTEIVSKHFNLPLNQAGQLAVLSHGNPRAAFLLADNNEEEGIKNLDLFKDFMRICLRFDALKIVAWIERFSSLGREKQKQFLSYALYIFRNSLILRNAPDAFSATEEEKEFLSKFANYITLQNAENITEEFGKAFYHIERNASPKITCMDLALKTNELLNKK